MSDIATGRSLSSMELRKAWAVLQREAQASGTEPGYRISVAGTFTVDPVLPYLGHSLAMLTGQTPSITIGPYDQLLQSCFDWRAAFGEDVGVIVLMWRIEDFLRAELQEALRGVEGAIGRARDRIAELASAIKYLRSDFGGTIVVTVPPYPHGSDLDIRHIANVGTAGRFYRAIIEDWIDAVEQMNNVELLDLDGLQRHAGVAATLDVRKWYLYRQPFTEGFWQDIGEALARLLAAQTIASKKCVVLDCDNTLWGGVIGEDGLGGVKIGDDHPGSAFRDFQQQLLTLRSQGVMLAICSKNNEADVFEVFDNHDRMVLRREHFAAHRINWEDKPSNIVEIARELNIGLDSLVFIDDSAIEIGHVNEALPMVTTIMVPAETSALPGALSSFRAFDRLAVTVEDRARNEMMAQESQRRAVGEKAVSKEEFIRSLQMRVDVFPVTSATIERATQLVNKTNQFNLTTRRRDLNEVAALMNDPDWSALAMRAEDRFGDYGIVGLAFVDLRDDPGMIDTFLMSCRVLGRNVEEAFLAAVAQAARKRGKSRLVGRFVPSAKNQMVASFYPDRNFQPQNENEWVAALEDIAPWPAHVQGGLID